MVQEWNPNFEEENGSLVFLERMERRFLDLEAKDAHSDLGNLFRYVKNLFPHRERENTDIGLFIYTRNTSCTPQTFITFQFFFF